MTILDPKRSRRGISRRIVAAVSLLALALTLPLAAMRAAAQQPNEPTDPLPFRPATQPAGGLQSVLGIDLTGVPSTADVASVTDLYGPAPDQPARIVTKPEVFVMPLRESSTVQPGNPNRETIWLRYPYKLNRFYITWRPAGENPQVRIYGPIQGDPFEVMQLEARMTRRMSERYEPDDSARVRMMLRQPDRRMTERGLRMISALFEADMSLTNRNIYLRQFQSAIDESRENLIQNAPADALARVDGLLAQQAAESERRVVELPLTDYTPAGNAEPIVPQNIPDRAWGEPVNGLRMALVPTADSVSIGEGLSMLVVVENTSDQPIKLAERGHFQSGRFRVSGPTGQVMEVYPIRRTGLIAINRYLLRPGDKLVVTTAYVAFRATREQRGPEQINSYVVGDPGEYIISFTARFPNGNSYANLDGGQVQVYPAVGEFEGALTSGEAAIRVRDR